LILIIGGGIGGLTLALNLHKAGISCQIFEAAETIKPLGVGINILPHAMKELSALELGADIAANAIETHEVCFYNRFGQHIYTEPRGRFAGYEWPQYSIHRGSLHEILVNAVRERLGPNAFLTGTPVLSVGTGCTKVTAYFYTEDSEQILKPYSGSALVGCDGIKSVVRRSFYKEDDPLIYSGITMWRGVTKHQPFLSGASMIYAGWLKTGKFIAYPIAKLDNGMQIVNWLCEFYCSPRNPSGDWGQPGNVDDFLWSCEEMNFPWLNIPQMVKDAEFILEYPMVDKEPLKKWSFGRTTLLGDAAHPMYPRGSNGAGQAIIDARSLG
jgi:2-polyprenyl-6-methoxyphenol hydroxylase-like FAD-dependent oxidoreductase